MRYQIVWLEYFADEEAYETAKESFPHSEHTGYLMGDLEIEVWDYFTAENDQQAKEYVKKHYPDLAVFEVQRILRAFTDMDFRQKDTLTVTKK